MTRTALGRFLLGSVVALAAYVAVFILVVDPDQIPPLDTSSLLLVVLAGLFQLVGVWFFGELFRQGVTASERFVSPANAFRAALVGSTVARILPAGGAVTPVAMSWTVRDEAVGTGGAAFRATALNYAGLLIGTGAAVSYLGLADPPTSWPAVVTTAGIIGLVIGVALMGASARLGWINRRLPEKIRRRFGPSVIDQPPDLRAQGLLWGRLAAEAAVLWLVLAAFEFDIGVIEVIAAFGLSQIAAGIPGTPGGLGFAEAGLVGALALFGFPASATIAPVLVFRLVSYWLPAGAGLATGSATFIEQRSTVADMDVSFTLTADDGTQVSSSDYDDSRLIVFFYPKAMTPGCTTEACDFRDSYDDLLDAGYDIVGISPDPPEANARFREEQGLPFRLLSDEDHAVAERFGAWGTKKRYGKEVEGLIRSTFVIGVDGELEQEFRNVKATGHVDRLKRELLED